MPAKAEIVPATLEHAEAMAPHLRQADRDELWAASRSLPADSLRNGVRSSSFARAGLIDGEVACLFGVAPQSRLTGSGFAWMLATPLIEEHQILFLRRCRPVVREMGQGFRYLHNYVDARNVTAIRWLRWLGFTIHDPAPHGALGLPFHHFEMRPHV